MHDLVELGEAQIRRDLEQHRRVAGLLAHAVACLEHLRQEIVEDVALLKVAQSRRIRRGDVDGEIARDRRKGLDQRDIVADAIGQILVGADIDADDAAVIGARGEPAQHGFGAVIVEAHAVDHGFVALEPEQPRPRIAALRLRRHRADLDEAEAEPQQRVRHLGILVEARGHADRIGKVEAEGAHRELGIVSAQLDRRQEFQAVDREAMRILGIDPAQQRQREGVEGADHGFSSGMSCEPSARACIVLYAVHRAEIEFAIEMRKQLVIARALPAQRRAKRIGIDLDQEQAGLAEEMLSRGLRDLGAVEKWM